MSRTVTIRNVPDDVADELAERASSRGRSLQSFVLSLLCREASTPDTDSILRSVREEARADGHDLENEDLLRILDEERSH